MWLKRCEVSCNLILIPAVNLQWGTSSSISPNKIYVWYNGISYYKENSNNMTCWIVLYGLKIQGNYKGSVTEKSTH